MKRAERIKISFPLTCNRIWEGDIDVRRVLEKVEEKYGLKLPRKVVTVDYGDDVGDLFIRFKCVEDSEGEPTEDGRVIVHYDKRGSVVAVEITDITVL